MSKLFAIFFLLLLSVCLSGQIPVGYYTTAQGLSGDNLKATLYNIIKGHTEYPYTSTNTDTWDILKQTDKDILNSANVILFYTGASVNAAQEYNNGSGWTREHIWAKSRGLNTRNQQKEVEKKCMIPDAHFYPLYFCNLSLSFFFENYLYFRRLYKKDFAIL